MKHLLSIADLSRDEAIEVLDTAAELARLSEGRYIWGFVK